MAVKENWADGNVLYSADLNPLGAQINENDENLDVVQVNLNEALIDIVQLQADAAITVPTHSASVADIFSDATGYANTVASATAIFLTTTYVKAGNAVLNHYAAGIGDPVAVITNGDFATGDLTGWNDASISPGSVTVTSNKCNLNPGAPGHPAQGIITQTIDVTNVSWVRATFTGHTGGVCSFGIGSNIIDVSGNATYTIFCGHLTGNQTLTATAGHGASIIVDDFIALGPLAGSLIQTVSLVSSNATDINSTWLTVKDYLGNFITGTYSVSSDGGSNYTDGVAFNEKANITSTLGDELKIKINVGSSDIDNAYSIAWWD